MVEMVHIQAPVELYLFVFSNFALDIPIQIVNWAVEPFLLLMFLSCILDLPDLCHGNKEF